MYQAKRKTDRNSPEWKAYPEEVRRNTFTREGTMVAFPTCFPGATVAFPPDESHITALDVVADGTVYGGAGGRQAHLFVATFHSYTGMVMEIGKPEGATSCPAICCGAGRFVAFVNGPHGGRMVGAPLQWVNEDLIQEWNFTIAPLADYGECAAGEPVVDAVATAARDLAVGITKNHLFTAEIASPKVRVVGEVPGAGRIAVASGGGIVGAEGGGRLWHFDPKSGALRRGAFALPEGDWSAPLEWAREARTGLLYTADAAGRLFSFDESRGFGGPLGQTPLTPVGPMAATLDGRVFGFCGSEMANMFCYDPAARQAANLGVAVSVIERRRYGYEFGAAATGRNGEIFFGENDNGGHLWIYFPSIRAV